MVIPDAMPLFQSNVPPDRMTKPAPESTAPVGLPDSWRLVTVVPSTSSDGPVTGRSTIAVSPVPGTPLGDHCVESLHRRGLVPEPGGVKV